MGKALFRRQIKGVFTGVVMGWWIVCGTSLAGGNRLSAPVIDQLKLSDHLYFLRVSTRLGNTTSVIYSDNHQTLLIDPNFNHTSDAIKQQFRLMNIAPASYLSSSHAHRDHIEQYADFKRRAIVILPEAQVDAVKQWGGKRTLFLRTVLL